MDQSNSSRRKFLRQLGTASLLVPLATLDGISEEAYEKRILSAPKKISANDRIRVACVGAGIMGHANVQVARQVPGVELAGVCDLYTGRLTRMQEMYGKDLLDRSSFTMQPTPHS